MIDEAEIFEFANLSPKEHGFDVDIKLRLLQPGDRKLPHGPRVRFFKKDPKVGFSITLDHNPEKIKLVSGHRPLVSRSDLNKLIRNVIKYREVFLKFWNDPGMTTGELRKIMYKIDDDEMFRMAHFSPEDTGIPVVIWVEESGDVKDRYPRMTVMTHPGKMNYEEAVLVTVKDPPRVIGVLKPSIKKKVVEFINLNRDALMAYWNQKLSTMQFIRRLRKVKKQYTKDF